MRIVCSRQYAVGNELIGKTMFEIDLEYLRLRREIKELKEQFRKKGRKLIADSNVAHS